ncbi:MAG: nucleoside 2-deoxyribosyltransferase [Alphaproteobacteria bacterium]|nr:nucleoside 2-deoxyribosyltransferase [Alphaproteobacteria bacterium]
MPKQTVLIIGEVFVDTHLDIMIKGTPLVRMGGIFHAARGLAALDVSFALAYYCPDYLVDDVNYWSCFLHTKGCYQLGRINRAPNVMLISESTESGNQGYVNLLKDQTEYIELKELQDIIEKIDPTDILLFPGRFDYIKLVKVLEAFPGKLHIDAHYDSDGLFDYINREIETLFTSTSSTIFSQDCKGDIEKLIQYYQKCNIQKLLLKENRGGSRCFLLSTNTQVETSAHHVPEMHSVGVGDVYDAVFISHILGVNSVNEENVEKQMALASLCAAKYAETMDYDRFKQKAQQVFANIEEWKTLKGIRLPWEKRKEMNIYLAAPDFPDVDTSLLDKLYGNLYYHNFSPRRPVQENGLATKELTDEQKLLLYQKDCAMLNECVLLIAVLLNNDPGTLIELGMFKQSGKPTIIYDPFHICSNMFAAHTPDYLCDNLTAVIDTVFLCLGEK